MTSDVPVKELRPLADWRDELGLDRLRADLIDGDLDAWWQHYATGEWHQIPRAHWQREKTVEDAIGWGWPVGGGLFSRDHHWCAIHAARPRPSATPTVTDSHPGAALQPPPPGQRRTPPGWAQKPVIRKLREKYHPDGIPPEGTTISEACREIGLDSQRMWHTVNRAVKYLSRLRG